MSYLNSENKPLDPRDECIDMKEGVIYEFGNRKEQMYHWGAMVADLCDMPVEEYMKPSTVIVQNGGGSSDDEGGGEGGGGESESGSTPSTFEAIVMYGYVKVSDFENDAENALLNEASLTNLNATAKTISNLQITVPAIDIPGLNDQEPDEPLGIQAAGEAVYLVFITDKELKELNEGMGNIISNAYTHSTITLDGETFHLYRSNDSQNSCYDSNYEEGNDLVYKYKVIYK
jgi:hypothetical protein